MSSSQGISRQHTSSLSHFSISFAVLFLLPCFFIIVRTAEAKPQPFAAFPIFVEPLPMQHAAADELILVPSRDVGPVANWMLPKRGPLLMAMNTKRGSLGPRPLRFGK